MLIDAEKELLLTGVKNAGVILPRHSGEAFLWSSHIKVFLIKYLLQINGFVEPALEPVIFGRNTAAGPGPEDTFVVVIAIVLALLRGHHICYGAAVSNLFVAGSISNLSVILEAVWSLGHCKGGKRKGCRMSVTLLSSKLVGVGHLPQLGLQ